ncbi:MAG: hypothetical protein JWQ66_4220 [Mucilaginibacter sp.]|nr:hypothetical protein [Mucilaginibacter sp.]
MKKNHISSFSLPAVAGACLLIVLCGSFGTLLAQKKAAKDTVHNKTTAVPDTTVVAPAGKRNPYIKNTFEGNYIIDNQTVMVPIKGTFEFDIQHRFGTVNNGFSDLFGMFAGATMKFGFSYTPVNNLQVGFDATNENMEIDLNLKYALLKQTKDGSMPVSITYFGNAMADTRKKDATTVFVTTSDRIAYFNQIIIARKFSEKFSLQIAPSYTHFNDLLGYLDANGIVNAIYKNDNFSIAASGRYKISEESSIIVNYDQPLTQNPANNPRPNISFGIEMKTSGHDFEIFFGNYSSLMPENNNVFNQNNYRKGQFLIGFDISRLWNF